MANVRDARLFDVDDTTGRVEFFHFNPEDDSFVIQTQEDLEPLFELNRYDFNERSGFKTDLVHVARIPEVIRIKLWQEGILRPDGSIIDEPRFKKWLNDRDNRMFRTLPGNV